MEKNYKSILGLNTVKAFIVVMLSLAIIGVVTLIVLGSLRNTGIVPAGSLSATVVNESGWINSSGYTLDTASTVGFTSPVIVTAINGTDGQVIVAANYTVSAAGVVTNASAIVWNPANITYTYSYDSTLRNDVGSVISNTSSGITGFFANSGTFFALLGVVVIILIISLVVVVVNRFGGGREGSSEQPSL